MAGRSQNDNNSSSNFHRSKEEDNGLVAFESELPCELLTMLNDTYQQTKLPSSSVPPQIKRTRPKPSSQARKGESHGHSGLCLGSIWLLILPVLVLSCAMIYYIQVSRMRSPIPNAKNPKVLIRNLARRSQGAHIIEGYTSPPSRITLLPWSSSYKADPECLIRSSVHECWPFRGETAVGIGLEAPSQVYTIKANMSFSSTRDPSKLEHLVREVSVFSVNSDGVIHKVGQSAHNSTEVHITPGKITSRLFIIRVRILLLGKPWKQALGCLLSLEIWGVPEEEMAASLAQPPSEPPTVLSLESY